MQEQTQTPKGPECKFRAGAISATVWKNEHKKQTGETFTVHSVSLERRYKDKSGEWKNTHSFRLQDLPKAVLVMQEAWKYVVLNGLNTEQAE